MAPKRLYSLNESYFETIDTSEKAYWLGFITADGCVYISPESSPKAGCGTLVINLASKDGGHLSKLSLALGSNRPVRDHLSPGYRRGGRAKSFPQRRVVYNSRILTSHLVALGITPRKTLTVKPWGGPAHLMPHYWRGVIDGDGCWYGKGQWSMTLAGSQAVTTGFGEFAKLSVGSTSLPRKAGNSYRLAITGIERLKALATILYRDATVFLDRKKIIVDQLMATNRKFRVWSHLSKDTMVGLLHEHGTLCRVAEALGTNASQVGAIRKRLGIPSKKVDLSHMTAKCLIDLCNKLGGWTFVASHLGVRSLRILNMRKRLGIYQRTSRWKKQMA